MTSLGRERAAAPETDLQLAADYSNSVRAKPSAVPTDV